MESFDKLLASYPSSVQALAVDARRLIVKLLPRVEETVDAAAGVIGYGYGAGYRGTICTLILSKSGVKLGLVRGAELADPNGLLEGSGKVHRHVPLRSTEDLSRTGVNELIEAARVAWQERTTPRSVRATGRGR